MQTFCMEELFQTAVLTHSPSVSIQRDFPAVSTGKKMFLFWCDQLKSFIHQRTNLSPFTKDFRVWETPIENLNYLSSFLWGSNLNSRSSTLLRSKSHQYASIGKPHQTFPNQSFHQIIDINSSRALKQKWETLQKNFEANSTQCSQAVTHPSTD